MPLRRLLALAMLSILPVALGAGCAVSRETPVVPLDPVFSTETIETHLEQFGELPEDPARAADYAARRLDEFNVQPVFRSGFRVRFAGTDTSGADDVLGYLAGKHPVRAGELVLVCADFAAGGLALAADSALAASALLEAARVLGEASRFHRLPQRTVLFALWSGRPGGGLGSFLAEPTWALGRLRAVIYAGLPASREAEVGALLAPHGVPLVRLAPAREDAPPAPGASAPEEQARRLALAVYATVLDEATSPLPFRPVDGDTLRAPVIRVVW